jgi:glycosyltransferase involved in cell wall biosynthesis
VVAARAGGIPEFVVDGDNGLLVAGGDADALATALTRLVADPALAERLARRGRRTAEAGHGIGDRADALADVYRLATRRAARFRSGVRA